MKMVPVDDVYNNAYIRVNYTTEDKLECVFRWMREGDNSKRYIIMMNKIDGETQGCLSLDCEDLITICHDDRFAALEVCAVIREEAESEQCAMEENRSS